MVCTIDRIRVVEALCLLAEIYLVLDCTVSFQIHTSQSKIFGFRVAGIEKWKVSYWQPGSHGFSWNVLDDSINHEFCLCDFFPPPRIRTRLSLKSSKTNQQRRPSTQFYLQHNGSDFFGSILCIVFGNQNYYSRLPPTPILCQQLRETSAAPSL